MLGDCLAQTLDVWLSVQGGRPGLDDVSSLDATLHSNLLAVKACPPEQVEHLCLAFAAEQQLLGKVSTDQLGGRALLCDHSSTPRTTSAQQEADPCSWLCERHAQTPGLCVYLLTLCLQTLQYSLLPNGGSIAVTASNRLLYVYLLADWHLNTRLGRAADAFASEWTTSKDVRGTVHTDS